MADTEERGSCCPGVKQGVQRVRSARLPRWTPEQWKAFKRAFWCYL